MNSPLSELDSPITLPSSASWNAMELHFHLSAFLVYEAQLLDQHRYPEWLTLLGQEISYKVPVQRNTLRRRRNSAVPEHAPIEMAHHDDNRALLEMRVAQLESGQNWAEEPRSHSRHFITNIRVKLIEAEAGSTSGVTSEVTSGVTARVTSDTQRFEVRSNFLVTRSRGESEHDQWEGERTDVIRWSEADMAEGLQKGRDIGVLNGFRIEKRLAVLDSNVIRSKNLSIFF